MNYNSEPEIFKRGNILIRMAPKQKKRDLKALEKEEAKNDAAQEEKQEIILVHDDLIEKEAFYEKYELYVKFK